MAAAANIGMMDNAYFVGRNESLSWINNTLQLNLGKVEEAASSAVQCQMVDMIHPGVVAIHKVPRQLKCFDSTYPNSASQTKNDDQVMQAHHANGEGDSVIELV